MAEIQTVVSPELFAKLQQASYDLEQAMRKARLTERQMKDVGAALQEYFHKVEEIAKAQQAAQPVTGPDPNKTGWTEEDLKPFLDAGAIRLK
jgi:hypothetical protein